eukprot:TRINITY_DN8269_c0_g1_i1.p1 TRINITY_DN8269_c0_g1~~TRINITY_DN8269_c0_g1_i1.p1  ORF type:complete len:191 (-),score=46.28 TRINITY_DN8269_c0_g1_i1:60-632(-)
MSDDTAPAGTRKKTRCAFPQARIKKIMQTDEEVGKIASLTTVVMSAAIEIFLEDFVQQAAHVASKRGGATLQTGHVKEAVMADKRLDFLQDKVQFVPDLPASTESEAKPKAKRLRAKASDDAPKKPRAKPAKTDGQQPKKAAKGKKAQTAESDAKTAATPVSLVAAPAQPTLLTAPVPTLWKDDDDYDNL